jgi:hypothetical protein
MKRLVCILGLVGALGCGGQGVELKQASGADGTQSKMTIEARMATAYSGPKIRVAVGQFKEMEATVKLFKEMGWSGIAPSLTEQITTALERKVTHDFLDLLAF